MALIRTRFFGAARSGVEVAAGAAFLSEAAVEAVRMRVTRGALSAGFLGDDGFLVAKITLQLNSLLTADCQVTL